MMSEEPSFVIAHGAEIHKGTQADAGSLLEYVKFFTGNEPHKDYAIR